MFVFDSPPSFLLCGLMTQPLALFGERLLKIFDFIFLLAPFDIRADAFLLRHEKRR